LRWSRVPFIAWKQADNVVDVRYDMISLRPMMNRTLCAAAMLAGVACSSGAKDGWVVAVQVRGPEAAFAGRQIVLRAKVEKVAPAPGGAGAGVFGTTVAFATCDHDRFLSAPIDIEILEGDATVSAVTLDRVGCKFASVPGYHESNYLFLEETGNLLATLDGSDPRVYASCGNAGQPFVCGNDEL
jgi:hypothetical protein